MLGESATSLAAAAASVSEPRSRQDAADQRLERASPLATADRLCRDRRRRRMADRREDPAPLRRAAVRLRDSDEGRPRGDADGAARVQARRRGACATDRGPEAGAPRRRTGISRGLRGGRPHRARRQGPVDAGAEGGPAHRAAFERRTRALAHGRRNPGRCRPGAASCSARATIRRSWRS